MICDQASDFEVIPRREGDRIVDFDVRTFCKGCGERDCACPDPVYQGVCPPLGGTRRDDPDASGAAEPFHGAGDTRA